jgi:hypothetical protein
VASPPLQWASLQQNLANQAADPPREIAENLEKSFTQVNDVNGDNDSMSKSVQQENNSGNAEAPESDDANNINNKKANANEAEANEAEANEANVGKNAIDSATKPIETNEANKSHAHQDSDKESTSNGENSDNKPICCGDVINYYCPIFVSGGPQGLKEAMVLAVDLDHAYPLTLSTYDYLSS